MTCGTRQRSARIVAVPGDLSKPLLGLSVKQFEMMADVVDAVYHSAAIVHAVYSYDLIKGCKMCLELKRL